jgi:hypothetical protein
MKGSRAWMDEQGIAYGARDIDHPGSRPARRLFIAPARCRGTELVAHGVGHHHLPGRGASLRQRLGAAERPVHVHFTYVSKKRVEHVANRMSVSVFHTEAFC